MAGSAAPAVVREVIDIRGFEGEITVQEYPGNALPPDIAYCLDAEVEFGGIGGDDRAFVDLFDVDTPTWFDALVEDGGPGGVRFPDVVRARHLAWRETAPADEAMALDWAGLGTLRFLFDECAGAVSYQLAEIVPQGSGEDALLAAMGRCTEAERIARIAAPIVARSVADARRWGIDAFRESQGRIQGLYERRSENLRIRDAEVRRLEAARRERLAKPKNSRERRKERGARDRGRRMLSRSVAFLENLVGRERARAWLTGDAVTVEGRRFDFRLRVKDPSLAGHGALDVSVTDKDGIELASLCVYVPETPALDQVSAMILSVSSGDEDEILRRANVIRATQAGLAHAAFLAVRADRPMPAAPPPPPPPDTEEGRAREAALREVGAVIDEYVAVGQAERALREPARRALARWLAEGALAPLGAILGGPEGVAALVPIERQERLAA